MFTRKIIQYLTIMITMLFSSQLWADMSMEPIPENGTTKPFVMKISPDVDMPTLRINVGDLKDMMKKDPSRPKNMVYDDGKLGGNPSSKMIILGLLLSLAIISAGIFWKKTQKNKQLSIAIIMISGSCLLATAIVYADVPNPQQLTPLSPKEKKQLPQPDSIKPNIKIEYKKLHENADIELVLPPNYPFPK